MAHPVLGFNAEFLPLVAEVGFAKDGDVVGHGEGRGLKLSICWYYSKALPLDSSLLFNIMFT